MKKAFFLSLLFAICAPCLPAHASNKSKSSAVSTSSAPSAPPASSAPASIPNLAQIAQSKEWQRHLHYKSNLFRGRRSGVDSKGFFFSSEGEKDPLKELEADIAAFEKGGGEYGKLKQPIDCAFPARKEFLERVLQRKFPASPKCEKLEEFWQKLDPAGVALVYSTAYPNNPASMFGHSFIKILGRKNTNQKGEQLGLLDWSFNYAAQVPPDENSFAFAYFGLTGGYPGQFSIIPYYAKINEYVYTEGRDIWEYELNLSPEEIRRLIYAIWELETNAHFDYFFADENCSYQLLTMLEIAKPEWDLSGYFIHVIPGESIKWVAKTPGAVKNLQFRPSTERKLRAMGEAMSKEEGRALEQARNGANNLSDLSALALESFLLLSQVDKKNKGDQWSQEDEKRYKEALKIKAQNKEMPPVLNYGGEKTRPDIGHGPYNVELGWFEKSYQSQNDHGVQFRFSGAYHELLDPDDGYMPHSQILWPNFAFHYSTKKKKLRVEEVEAFSIVSLTPWSILRKPIAWRLKASYQSILDLPCLSCYGTRIDGGAGSAHSLIPEKLTLWKFTGARLEAANALKKTVRASLQQELGALYTLPTSGKVLLEARILFEPMPQGRAPWRMEFHGGLSQTWQNKRGLRLESTLAQPLRKNESAKWDSRFMAVHYF